MRWLALLLALAPARAEAAFFGATFSGTIDFVDTQIDDGTFTVGAEVSGFFRIDASVADGEPLPSAGSYDGAVTDLFVTLGDYAADGSTGELFIRNGASPNADEFYVNGDVSGSPVAGFPVGSFTFDLVDTSFAAFSDDTIPSSLDLADFDIPSARLFFLDGMFSYEVDVTITSLAYVPAPEPAGVLLTAVGMATLAAVARGARARPSA